MDNHVILAYGFDGKGGAKPLIGDAISKEIKSENLAWVHMDATHTDTRSWLEKEVLYLDPFIIEALLADETRPRMTQIGDGVLLIMRGVNLNENAAPEDMVSIRLWIDKNRIISLRKRKLKAISDIEEKIKAGKAPKNSGEFISMLIARLFERMEPALAALDERVDDIEEQLLECADSELRGDIVHVRQQAIMFRRYMAPQRDAVGKLYNIDVNWLSDGNKRQILQSHDHIMRYVEDLDEIRERAQIVKDELANILSDRLNKNMYILSVIAAIFLPLGFLTGLLGVNLGGIPGADNSDSFWMFGGILSLIVILQILLFKKFKWF